MNSTYADELREVNAALIVASVQQHELAETAHYAEEAARASQARFEALFDASPMGMYLVDANFHLQLMSRTTRVTFGAALGKRELIGSDFEEVVHVLWPAETADEIVAQFQHTLHTGDSYKFPEFTAVRFDSQQREYYDWEIHRIDLPDREYGVVCYFSDISARVRAEQSLRASEIRYRHLFESAQDGILILEEEHGRIIDANPFITSLLGWNRELLLGKQLWQIGLLRDEEASRSMVRDLQDKKYVRYDHLPLKSAAGVEIEVEVIANVSRDHTGTIIQCNIRDITARSLLEITARQQAKALAELSRRKDEFLAMLSHELRNPLAPIRNAVNLLRMQRNVDPPQQEAHDMINRQVSHLTRLVEDLLEVSRVSTGRVHLQEVQFDLRQVVSGAVESSRSQSGQKAQTIAKSLPAAPVWVLGDAMRLEQVIVNLLNNASKYTDRQGHIWIGLEQQHDRAVLRVRDNGMGIAPEMLPHIFDLFTQVDKSLDRSQGGLGIGLALVRSLVTLHRGTVEARSTVGQGSEFIVSLPLVSPAPEIAVAPPKPVTSQANSLRVLVVDDSMDSAKSLAMLLRASGYLARVAYDAPSAFQVAVEYLPQVVLLDIGLPGIDGYGVAKWFREEPSLANVVLIAVTGYGEESDRQRTRAAGFDHHLVKPADFAMLQSLLATVAKGLG